MGVPFQANSKGGVNVQDGESDGAMASKLTAPLAPGGYYPLAHPVNFSSHGAEVEVVVEDDE